jgi:transposase
MEPVRVAASELRRRVPRIMLEVTDGNGADDLPPLPSASVDTPEGARMREETRMAKRKRRAFTPEFEADAVRLAQAGERSIPQVAKELDLTLGPHAARSQRRARDRTGSGREGLRRGAVRAPLGRAARGRVGDDACVRIRARAGGRGDHHPRRDRDGLHEGRFERSAVRRRDGARARVGEVELVVSEWAPASEVFGRPQT